MTVSAVTLNILDPGLGATSPGRVGPVYIGPSEKGTLNSVLYFNRTSDIVSTYGQGPLSEALASALAIAGGPVAGLRTPTATASTTSAVTVTRTSTSTGTFASTGTALDSYSIALQVVTTGTLGSGVVRYSLDGQLSWSDPVTIPAAGGIALGVSGLTWTPTAGAGPKYFEAGDLFTATTSEPQCDATGVTNAFSTANTGILAQSTVFPFVVVTCQFATGAASAAVAAALDTQLTAAFTSGKDMAAIMDAGSTDTASNVRTAMASFSSSRVNLVFGGETKVSSMPSQGKGFHSGPLANSVGSRATRVAPCTRLGRYASGSLVGVTAITHDASSDPSMDAANYTTARTYPGEGGYYLTDGRIKASSGSDYKRWDYRRVADLAAQTARASVKPYLQANIPTIEGGKIDPAKAAAIESKVLADLRAVLKDNTNDEGDKGYVSEVFFAVDQNYDMLTNDALQCVVAFRPLGAPALIKIDLGMVR